MYWLKCTDGKFRSGVTIWGKDWFIRQNEDELHVHIRMYRKGVNLGTYKTRLRRVLKRFCKKHIIIDSFENQQSLPPNFNGLKNFMTCVVEIHGLFTWPDDNATASWCLDYCASGAYLINIDV